MMSARVRLAVVTVATVFTMAVTASLGFWQLDRARQKTALQEQIDQRASLPAWQVDELLGASDPLAGVHRPVQLRGISDQRAVVGRYAARELRPGDLLQPSMLRDDAPSQPRYPNGALLTRGMVPFAVALRGLGPLSVHDRLNLGFSDSGGGAQLCSAAPDTAAVPYACRLLSSLRILYIDEAAGLLYVEVTPYQAQSLYALQAAGVVLWAERYAADAPQLSELSRLESRAIERSRLQAPAAP